MKPADPEIATIISIIYELVFAPKTWSGLVDVESSADNTCSIRSNLHDEILVERIRPHLEQALTLGEQHQHLAQPAARLALHQELSLHQELPFPVCIVSRDLALLSATSHAVSVVQHSPHLALSNKALQFQDNSRQRELISAVSEVIESGQSQVLNCGSTNDSVQTIVISPINWVGVTDNSAAAIFIDFHPNDVDGLVEALVGTFGLTHGEAQVANYLAQGLSLEEIADLKSCSIHTIRTQLKSTFNKTGTSRQGELISLVLSGPAIWLRLLNSHPQPVDTQPGPELVSVITLADGRNLSYAEHGPENGKPLLLCHHLLGDHNEAPLTSDLLHELNIRLIVPDRPGRGQSSVVETPTLAGWVDDVRQLMDTLSITQFSVLGFSSGGPFAAACAALLPDRVLQLGLVASLLPVDELPPGTPIGIKQQLLTALSRHWPGGGQKLLELRYHKLLGHPDETLSNFNMQGNDADVELFEDLELRRMRHKNYARATRISPSVFARELIMLSRPWDIRLGELSLPIQLWHGEQDDYVPVQQAVAMAETLACCSTHIRADWGHFFLFREWKSVFLEFVEKPFATGSCA